MSGGPALAVDSGSTPTRVVAALAWAALIVVVADWGFYALASARADSQRQTDAVAIAADLARKAAGGDAGATTKALAEVARRHGATIDATFASIEGGVDEFGISRGSVLEFAGKELGEDLRTRVGEHARSLGTAAADAHRRGTRIGFARLTLTLPDERVVVALPFRTDAKQAKASGAAGVVLEALPAPPDSAPWRWAAVLLAPLLLLLLLRLSVPGWIAGATTAVAATAIAIAAAPPIVDAVSGDLAVLGASLLFPHEATPAHAALATADTWLIATLLIFAALAGALMEPLAWLVRASYVDPAPYMYVGPAVLATGVLIFVPFAVGIGLAFTDRGGTFVGLGNYVEVIESIADAHSATHFWRTLLHTVIWTATNVTLHVTIGLALAIVLNQKNLRFKGLYRLLLIIPWAVPNYITALTWKWLFNTQYGPINAMLGALGVVPVDWLGESAVTNFIANLTTNVWLGFPFMMVISLGALQSIPAELYEAASIDGASGWQKFKHVTLPLLRPALFPAVILGTIWTFNAFNVIYLVSGGGPDHQTEILITEAYYLFTVLRRIGLAAAYSVLIFLLLLGYTLITNKLTKATEAVDQ